MAQLYSDPPFHPYDWSWKSPVTVIWVKGAFLATNLAAARTTDGVLTRVEAHVEGKIKLKYNNYNNEFEVVDGKLSWPEVDEEYCISFVFQGEFSKRVMAPDGKPVVQKGDSFLVRRDGLCFLSTYP